MNNSRSILFFISHQPNPRFVKQLNYLSRNNRVTLAYFERSSLATLNSSIAADVTTYNLGVVPNASNPVKRIWAYLTSILKIRKLLQRESFQVVLVNNIDVLVLYLLSRIGFINNSGKPRIAIEISDLREYVFSKGRIASMMRKLEKYLYTRYIDQLIVTSNKYYTHHFAEFFKGRSLS